VPAVAPDEHPITVVLDLVYPVGASRRRLTLHRLGGHDEPAGNLSRNRVRATTRHNAHLPMSLKVKGLLIGIDC
jgi:hypothetical protein